MNIRSSGLRGWRLFGVSSALVVVMSAAAIALQPDLIEGLRSAIRATARTSFVLFLMAFTASAFAVLVPSPLSKALVRERRFVGLAFAFSIRLTGKLAMANKRRQARQPSMRQAAFTS